jgi:exopolyphosphatase / guanosine-5'-triphosphate,3'-diphosphate pyrophosphatase
VEEKGEGRRNWEQAVGSSGTARALAEILQLAGYTDGSITPDGLDRLRSHLVKAGDMSRVDLRGLRADRVPVLPGGLAIMSATLSELKVESMVTTAGSMRQGML